MELTAEQKQLIAKEKEKKATEATSALEKQIALLTADLEATKKTNSESVEQKQAAVQEAALKKLKEEADVKKMLLTTEDDIDELSPKELLEIVGNATDEAMNAKGQLLIGEMEVPMAELSKKLDMIQQYLLRKEANEGVSAARSKHGDFDKYEKQIEGVFKKYPGINPEDAYILAKAEVAKDVPPTSEMETEKPISLGTRSTDAQEAHDKRKEEAKKNPTKNVGSSSRSFFKKALSEATDKVLKIKNNKQ